MSGWDGVDLEEVPGGRGTSPPSPRHVCGLMSDRSRTGRFTAPGPVRWHPLHCVSCCSACAPARPPAPRVVPAGGDLQHPAHARNRILGLMRSYELVDPDGIESVSRANQAAAFDRISRSMRSCRTSRRSRASSSWSLLRSPSVRLP